MGNISPILAARLNNTQNNISADTQVKQNVSLPSEPQQDKFVNSNAKTIGITAGGFTFGGIIGALKEKFAPKAIPLEIIKEHSKDETVLHLEAVSQVKNDAGTMLKNCVSKMLDNLELTKEETDFVNELGLITPQDIKFFPKLGDWAKEHILDTKTDMEIPLIDNIMPAPNFLTVSDNLKKEIKERWLDAFNGSGKYNDNNEFLDYISSRFFSNRKFALLKNGHSEKYVPFNISRETLPESAVLSDEIFSLKEIFNRTIADKDNKFGYDKLIYIETDDLNITVAEYIKKRADILMERLKNVLEKEKNAAINGFCSKQMLKSIGIGAAVVGGLSLCASLIYSKVKQHKNSDSN